MRNTRSDQGIRELHAARTLHGLTIQPGTAPLKRRKTFVPSGVIHHTNHRVIPIDQGHRNAENRQPVDQVGRAIQGVHHPAKTHVAIAGPGALFCEESRFGQHGRQALDQPGFGLLVYMTDQRIQAFGFDLVLCHFLFEKKGPNRTNHAFGSLCKRGQGTGLSMSSTVQINGRNQRPNHRLMVCLWSNASKTKPDTQVNVAISSAWVMVMPRNSMGALTRIFSIQKRSTPLNIK